jgi:hypothetical protein
LGLPFRRRLPQELAYECSELMGEWSGTLVAWGRTLPEGAVALQKEQVTGLQQYVVPQGVTPIDGALGCGWSVWETVPCNCGWLACPKMDEEKANVRTTAIGTYCNRVQILTSA